MTLGARLSSAVGIDAVIAKGSLADMAKSLKKIDWAQSKLIVECFRISVGSALSLLPILAHIAGRQSWLKAQWTLKP